MNINKGMARKVLPLFALIGIASFFGCTTPMHFTRVSEREYPAKMKHCEFKIRSSFPDKNYEEIGTINLATNLYGINHASDLSKFKTMVSDQVCLSGADMVVPDVNGMGYYVRAILFKQVDAALNE